MTDFSSLEFYTYSEVSDDSFTYPSLALITPNQLNPFGLPCIQPGSWSDTTLPNGNVQTAFTIWNNGSDAMRITMSQLAAFFTRVNDKVERDTSREKHVVRYRSYGQIATREARVVSGGVYPIDGEIVERFQSKGSLWSVTYERLPRWEIPTQEKSAINEDTVQTGLLGGPGLGDTYLPSLDTVVALHGGRFNRTKISPLPPAPGEESVSIKKLWLGIWENYGDRLRAVTFDPSIQVGFDATLLANGTQPRQGLTGENFYDDAYLRITYYPSNIDSTDWKERFLVRMETWNDDTNQSGSAGVRARRDYVGRYRVLMRYRTTQPTADAENPIAKSLVRLNAYWTDQDTGNHELIHTGPLVHFYHQDEAFHWVDLGALTIGGEDWTRRDELVIDPVDYGIGLSTRAVGIPDDSNIWGQYNLLVDKLLLMPADKYLYLEMVGSANSKRDINVLIDDYGKATAYATYNTFAVDRSQKISDFSATNWTPPQRYGSKLIAAVETLEAAPEVNNYIDVQFWMTPTMAFDIQDLP